MSRLSIYDIKNNVQAAGSHFFDRKTLKFFGQTLKDFRVYKLDALNYLLIAPIRPPLGKPFLSSYIYNTITNEIKKYKNESNTSCR